MKENHYFISRTIRCGEMPLYIIFFSDRYGREGHCAMICTAKKLQEIQRLRDGFVDPTQYGYVIHRGRSSEPDEDFKAILKARFDIDYDYRYATD